MKPAKIAKDGNHDRPADDPLASLREAIDDLEEAWRTSERRSRFERWIIWTAEGPRLGAATLLARKVAGEEARLLALLSVAFDRPWPPAILRKLEFAETGFRLGDLAKSAMHVALANFPPIENRQSAYRLHIAAGLLDKGFLTPLDLMKLCEIAPTGVAALTKYSPDQPRAPAGDTDGGQWTREDGGAALEGPVSPALRREPSKPLQTAVLMPEGCDQEWNDAIAYLSSASRNAQSAKKPYRRTHDRDRLRQRLRKCAVWRQSGLKGNWNGASRPSFSTLQASRLALLPSPARPSFTGQGP